MEGTQLVKGVLDLAVLAVVAREDGYGYDVVRRLRAAGLDEVGGAAPNGRPGLSTHSSTPGHPFTPAAVCWESLARATTVTASVRPAPLSCADVG